jgi:Domain of unknown function (DUF5753)
VHEGEFAPVRNPVSELLFLSARSDVGRFRVADGDSIGPLLVPDLLQTPEYARAVLKARVPRSASGHLDQAVSDLAKRQSVLCRCTPPVLWCVVGEAALRCVVGGREVMREQVVALLAASESQMAVIQVVPYDAGAYVGLDGALTFLSFEEGVISGTSAATEARCPSRHRTR